MQIKNIPSHVARESIESLVESFVPGGSLQKYEEVGAEGAVYITFDSPENAQQYVSVFFLLNEYATQNISVISPGSDIRS